MGAPWNSSKFFHQNSTSDFAVPHHSILVYHPVLLRIMSYIPLVLSLVTGPTANDIDTNIPANLASSFAFGLPFDRNILNHFTKPFTLFSVTKTFPSNRSNTNPRIFGFCDGCQHDFSSFATQPALCRVSISVAAIFLPSISDSPPAEPSSKNIMQRIPIALQYLTITLTILLNRCGAVDKPNGRDLKQ